MTTTSTPHRLTERDLDLLAAIDLHPLTVEQLLKLSRTFREPFTQVRLLQRRLKRLSDAGYVRGRPLATTTGASPHYFRLTRTGYRLLHGDHAPLPSRRQFSEIAFGHHHHTRCLGEFLAHLIVHTARSGVRMHGYTRENEAKIEADGLTLYPDCTFHLSLRTGQSFSYIVELDNGSERVRSARNVESIERKIRGYDAYQSRFDALDPNRPVVLFLTTRSCERTRHILDAAKQIMSNPNRTVFLAADLRTFLSTTDPLSTQYLTDNRGRKRGLLPATVCRLGASTASSSLFPALC